MTDVTELSIDLISKKAFEAAREKYDAIYEIMGRAGYLGLGDSGFRYKYPTYEDYKKSLDEKVNQPKDES